MTRDQEIANIAIEECLSEAPYSQAQFLKLLGYVKELEMQNVKLFEENAELKAQLELDHECR